MVQAYIAAKIQRQICDNLKWETVKLGFLRVRLGDSA